MYITYICPACGHLAAKVIGTRSVYIANQYFHAIDLWCQMCGSKSSITYGYSDNALTIQYAE